MQEQEIEGVDPAPLEAALGRHLEVVGVARGTAELGIGEAGKALRAGTLAGVEIVADRPDDAHLITRQTLDRAAEHRVGVAGAVDVGGDDGRDALVGRDQPGEALVVERLAEAHEAPAAPGSDRARAEVEGHGLSVGGGRTAPFQRAVDQALQAGGRSGPSSGRSNMDGYRWRHHLPLIRSWKTTSLRPPVVTTSQ